MKKYLNRFLIAAFCGAVFFACSEDFLDVPAQGKLDEATLANQDGVEANLISAYSMLDGWNANWGVFSPPWGGAGSNWIWGSVPTDEAHKGSEPGDQGEIQEVELFSWSPGNGYFNVKFQALYEGIARSNATLKLAATVDDLTDRERIEAEARFLRAHYHFDAWKLWENIPYYTEADEDFRKPNDTDPIPSIMADFQYAIDNLPVTQGSVGRATKGAAQAYMGKVLIYTGDYAKAKEQFDAVVNSGTYELSPCFHDVFTTDGENGPEMIFSIQASVNDGATDGDNGNFADRLNHPHGGSPFGCCGFHQPTQNLVNSHRVDASGLPMIASFNDVDEIPDGDPVDPRLDWTVGRDGVPFLDWGLHDETWIRARSWAGPYSSKKFIHSSTETHSSGWSNVQLSPVNIPIIRYADVLLMLAECEVEVGSLERARELVNMVRERAAGCAIGPDGASVALDDAGITWATYDVGTYDTPWSDANAARDAVRFERKIELAMEGHRLFDLRRWGIDEQVINDYLEVEKTRREFLTASGGFEPRHHLYPLPSAQVELSKVDGVAQLKQNEGY